jgi:hypothetical protein
VVVRQFTQAINGLLGGDDPELYPTSADNNIQMKREAEQKQLHQMAKVHNFLDMWQVSQNLQATQKGSHTQNKQMTAVE